MGGAPEFTIVDRERMSILGLMLGGIVEANLEDPRRAALARRLGGSLGVTAGKMSVTLSFRGDSIAMTRGLADRCRARVRGSLDGLLGVSLGKGPTRAFLSGEIGFSGNPLFALKTLPLPRAPPRRETGSSG